MIKKKNTKKRGTTKKKVTKYQAGGITQNQYADNVIPGAYNPTTAHISANQSDPAVTASLVKRQEELGTEVDLTQVQADGVARTNNVDTVANTALTAGKTFAKAGTKAGLIGEGATASAGTLKAGMLAYKGARATKAAGNVIAGGKTAAGVGLTAASWAGPQAVGTAAAMLGKGIEKKYDDNDVTTMNAGETTGKVIKGAGYGAAAAGLAGSLGAFGTTMSWNPVGWAALAAAGIAGGVGLLQRRKGRKEEAKATTTFDNKQAEINKDRSTQETKDLTTTGYDFGDNFGMPGAMGSEQMRRRQTGGVHYQLGGNRAVRPKGQSLPGGAAVPIPGSDAVEYKGQSHKDGGIMVDANTEVENKETADGVTMADGRQKEYYFSDYLKHNGKSFAAEHKKVLANGGDQREIDRLAAVQENAAGRDPNAIQVAKTGGRKVEQYQNAGFNKSGIDYLGENELGYLPREEESPISLPRIGINSIPTSNEVKSPTLDPIYEENNSLFARANRYTKDRLAQYREGRAERDMNRDVPTSALVAGAGQMIPAAYAFAHKEKSPEQVGKAGRVTAPTLDRVNFDRERATSAAQGRARGKAITNSGAGPGGIAAMMASHAAKKDQDIQIASAEARANSAISNQEAGMKMQANSQNVANDLRVDSMNTQINEAQRISVEDSKREALDVGFKNIAGINSDILSYKAEERLAETYGAEGIFERERLRGTVDPDTGEIFTNKRINEIVNEKLGRTKTEAKSETETRN